MSIHRSLRHESALDSTNDNTGYEMEATDGTTPTNNNDESQFLRTFGVTTEIAMKLIQSCIMQDPENFHEHGIVPDSEGEAIPADVKVLAVLKTLRFGTSFAAFQGQFAMDESTIRKSFHQLFKAILSDSELLQTYLAPMTRTDAQEVTKKHLELHKVPGMAFSIGSRRIEWTNCPESYAGQWKVGKGASGAIVLEAGVDSDLYFWHATVAFPGEDDDDSIISNRPPMHEILDSGEWLRNIDPIEKLEIGGEKFHHLWFVVGRNYLDHHRCVKTIIDPQTDDERHFARWHESAFMDIKRAFGILHSKFRWLVRPFEIFSPDEIKNAILGCVMMHNMMVRHHQKLGIRDDYKYYAMDESLREKLRVEINTENEQKQVLKELFETSGDAALNSAVSWETYDDMSSSSSRPDPTRDEPGLEQIMLDPSLKEARRCSNEYSACTNLILAIIRELRPIQT